jgi:hypothetical protein
MLGQILIDFMAMDSYGPTKRANSGVQPGIVWDTLGIIGTRILLVTGGISFAAACSDGRHLLFVGAGPGFDSFGLEVGVIHEKIAK